MKITAGDVHELLRVRHSKDLYVAECKNGPSYGAPMGKMDAWVMKKSWAKFSTICYEIKVSRSDFINDDKWPIYLDYCNEFYFVSPPGVIEKDEVPEQAGLLHTSKNCTRLYTRKKAPVRTGAINPNVYIYLLMWRTRVCRENTGQSTIFVQNPQQNKRRRARRGTFDVFSNGRRFLSSRASASS